MEFDFEGSDFGSWESECQGCDTFARVGDLGLCEECCAKLERDMLRTRDWDYSATAFGAPPEKREELRASIIKKYGSAMELIASGPSGEAHRHETPQSAAKEESQSPTLARRGDRADDQEHKRTISRRQKMKGDKKDSGEIRCEYDFAGGTRGKHAAGTSKPTHPKISEAFLAFSKPILEAMPAESTASDLEKALQTPFVVWNAVVLSDHGKPEFLRKVHKLLPPGSPENELVVELVARKISSFADDNRLIGQYKIRTKNGELNLWAEAREPGT